MRSHITRILAIATVGLVLSTSAEAQGRGNGKSKEKSATIRRSDRGDVIVRGSHGDVVRVERGRRVPPGLAKKPGRMPPGQYKKIYNSYEGATVLGDIMRRRGYTVLRVVPASDARYVYYRYGNGLERRAIVRRGSDRLHFSNVPTSILQAVMAYLY